MEALPPLTATPKEILHMVLEVYFRSTTIYVEPDNDETQPVVLSGSVGNFGHRLAILSTSKEIHNLSQQFVLRDFMPRCVGFRHGNCIIRPHGTIQLGNCAMFASDLDRISGNEKFARELLDDPVASCRESYPRLREISVRHCVTIDSGSCSNVRHFIRC